MTSGLAYSTAPRTCPACKQGRGTNPACATCRARRAAETSRVNRTRDEWRSRGLCGRCGQRPTQPGVHCADCRREVRELARARRLREWL